MQYPSEPFRIKVTNSRNNLIKRFSKDQTAHMV